MTHTTGMLGNSGLAGLAGAGSPEDAAKMFQGYALIDGVVGVCLDLLCRMGALIGWRSVCAMRKAEPYVSLSDGKEKDPSPPFFLAYTLTLTLPNPPNCRMDMAKVAKMYQAFIWRLVRSPIVAKYLESDEVCA